MDTIQPLKIIEKYYKKDSVAYHFLVEHSKSVTKKALEIAKSVKNLNPDIKFIEEAAMLHDIGIFLTNADEIGCNGKEPYIKHGILGREILEKEGLPKHALVCERHVGAGITKDEIKKRNLPLPKRDMIPITVEEKIIAFADKFFSKKDLTKEFTIEEARKDIARYGEDELNRFEEWIKLFAD